ncbi:MAG: VWA domain-containing protein [Paludibacteraceae bacterium]
METKHRVHNLILLDESGSMTSIKNTIIQGFNELVQTVKGIALQYPEQEHLISFFTFNGMGIKTLHFCEPVEKLSEIDERKYQPDAMTPLYDAMGFSFVKLRKELESITDFNVLVTILTDGEENSSREYSGEAIKRLVEELSQQRWTFTYIGADHDVEKFAVSISISNTMKFSKNEEDMKQMFAKEQSARAIYSRKIRMKEETGLFFYDEDDDKKDDKK